MSEPVPEIVVEPPDAVAAAAQEKEKEEEQLLVSKPAIPSVSQETAAFLEQYLPPLRQPHVSAKLQPPTLNQALQEQPKTRPFVTLTYATSLDSHLALAPSVPTHLSGPLTKSLTHYLRSRHDGILIGVGTATADDPSLNCRMEGVGGYNTCETLEELTESNLLIPNDDHEDDDYESYQLPGQPRPIILDPNRRWHFTRNSRIFQTVREGKGKAPIILTHASSQQGPGEAERWRILCEHDGLFMYPKEEKDTKEKSKHRTKTKGRWSWKYILEFLYKEADIKSLMIEGGGNVINDLLSRKENLELIDVVIITIAPVYLGKGGVNVSPDGGNVEARKAPSVTFKDVEWTVLGRDVVMAARPQLHAA